MKKLSNLSKQNIVTTLEPFEPTTTTFQHLLSLDKTSQVMMLRTNHSRSQTVSALN